MDNNFYKRRYSTFSTNSEDHEDSDNEDNDNEQIESETNVETNVEKKSWASIIKESIEKNFKKSSGYRKIN